MGFIAQPSGMMQGVGTGTQLVDSRNTSCVPVPTTPFRPLCRDPDGLHQRLAFIVERNLILARQHNRMEAVAPDLASRAWRSRADAGLGLGETRQASSGEEVLFQPTRDRL